MAVLHEKQNRVFLAVLRQRFSRVSLHAVTINSRASSAARRESNLTYIKNQWPWRTQVRYNANDR